MLNKMYHRVVARGAYSDRVCADMSNRVFYVYYLGRFNNRPLYHYGESHDAYDAHFRVHRSVPFCKRIVCIPVEDNTGGLQVFEDRVKDVRCSLPIAGLEGWAAFGDMEPEEAVSHAREVYKEAAST